MGAGMAGLGAALKLTELGCKDFVILEAQEEIGGRIKTITVDGRPLDIGAQWLHGKDNPLYHLAVKHDLLSEKMSEEGLGMFIRNDGVMFDDFLVKRVDFEVGRILEECQTFVDKIEHPVSVGDFMEQKFLEYLDACDDTNDLRQMKLELFDWHMRFQVIDNSCQNMRRLSAKYWGSYVCLDDTAHYNLKYGYDSLINVMADSLPKERIHLDCEVTEILYGEEHNGVKVICSNNQIFYCDHLIITASIGVLKEFAIIDPPLPTLLQTAIDNMGFYGIGKIYLIFDEKWWGNWKGFQFMWKSDTSYEEGEEWIRHVTGFDEVFNQPKVLIGWVGGEGVKEMESLTEDEVGNTCINVLRNFLPDFEIPQPNNVIRTKWFSNPWVKGSYCHITPECDDPHSGMDKMSEPVFVRGVPRIILAGEAVHPSHYSTTHGAFESGQEQAAVLHKYIIRE
ncbi:peroxisomal N(1)-acetyl-spermine/spermidine oxidase-like isoform X3 [Anoplophora glabripennis]|nr:peroxisomal N(1)-acetyl-spermine/spermidine oxidase-like isoform X3 [Anoplophora glabripennis]